MAAQPGVTGGVGMVCSLRGCAYVVCTRAECVDGIEEDIFAVILAEGKHGKYSRTYTCSKIFMSFDSFTLQLFMESWLLRSNPA
jgi:hypothetical protein